MRWSGAFCWLKSWGGKWKCASSPHLTGTVPSIFSTCYHPYGPGYGQLQTLPVLGRQHSKVLWEDRGGDPHQKSECWGGAQREARMARGCFMFGLKRILRIHTKSIRDEDKTAPTFPGYLVDFIASFPLWWLPYGKKQPLADELFFPGWGKLGM